MARQKPHLRELSVTFVAEVSSTPNGNFFLECVTDAGRAAFWGSPANSRSLGELQRRKPPFRVRSGCIEPSKSSFPGHDIWVPQTEEIEFVS